MRKNILIHINNNINKENLMKNMSRYWQFSRKKESFGENIPLEIMEELNTELENRDNELIKNKSIRTKVKEIVDENEPELQ